MKYLCLVYLDEKKLSDVPDRECQACGDSLREKGKLVAAEALQSINTATTVRVRNGKVSVTDGPFAETKELVSGFALWEVKSIEEAVEWVKKSPLTDADVEIRPLYGPETWDPK